MKKEIKYVGGRLSGKSYFDDELSPLEAFYDLLSPIGLKEEGLKRYNLIETTLKDYATRKTLIETIDSGEMVFEERTVWEEKQKKLKALEIIKESIPIEEEDFFYDSEFDTYLFIGHKVSKEQFDLLKEVLVCGKFRSGNFVKNI